MATPNHRAGRHARDFMKMLDGRGIKYTYMHERAGDNRDGVVCIELGGGGLNFPSLKFYMDFDFNNTGEGDSVHLTVYGIGSYSASTKMAALEAINEVANKKRFARFYLDDDNDLVCDADSWVSDETVVDRAYELLTTVASVINNTYDGFQKARWS